MAKRQKIPISCFRRSFRLDDNRALSHAVADADRIGPVFILDPHILNATVTGTTYVRFLCQSLSDFHRPAYGGL
jgi:deoxyribodipyrimidine photolyase